MNIRFWVSNTFRKIPFIALLISLLTACNKPPPQTIVTLHNIDPNQLEEVLEQSLGADVRFSITENKVVIFEELSNISTTLELLESLDTPPTILALYFRKLKEYDYSTTQSPSPFYIRENKSSKIVLSNQVVRIKFKRASREAFDFELITQKDNKNHAVVVKLKEGDWERIYLKGLEDFPLIKIEQQLNSIE